MARRQSFLTGAAVLSGAVAVTKMLGALYKIPLGNLLDAQGMAHFYAAYNVYTLLLTLSTAGLPLATSRLVSRAAALHRHTQVRRTLCAALWLLGGVGGLFALLMGLFPQWAAALLHDTQATLPILALAPAVLCVSLSSALRGFTQGLGDMRPTAVSQVIESACKPILGLALCAVLLHRGAPSHAAAAGAILGVTVGTLAGCVYLFLTLRRFPRTRGGECDSRRSIAAELLTIGVPITVSGGAMSLLTLLDQSLILSTLQNVLGYTPQQATTLYGEYTFGMTLFVLPSSFAVPLSVSLIPAISAARAEGRTRHSAALCDTALRLTALLSFPMGLGMSLLSEEILLLLYPAVPHTAAAAASHLSVLGIASIFVCMMVVSNGILQSCGREKLPMWTLLCGGAVKVLCNYLLVGNPAVGIDGAAVGTLYSYALIVVLNFLCIRFAAGLRQDYVSLLWRPALCAGLMGLFARAACPLLQSALGGAVGTVLTVAAAALVYLVLIFALRAVTADDLRQLPGGEKWVKRLHFQ